MLKFKNHCIVTENDKELAGLSVRPHLPEKDKYVVYLESVFDYMTADQIKSYIQAAEQMQPESIVQSAMLESFKKQLKQKLHDCLMATNPDYRYEFEIKMLKQQVQNLEESLAEERKKRWQAENELHELKMALKKSEEETEYQD